MSYVKAKVEKWAEDVEELAQIAKDEPHAALSAYNTGLSQRWTFLQRTMGLNADLYQPIEDKIRHQLIPALCGRQVSDLERRMLALPYRLGGMGIRNPVKSASSVHEASIKITKPLADLIVAQDMDITKLDAEVTKKTKKEVAAKRAAEASQEFEDIAGNLDEKAKRLLKCA